MRFKIGVLINGIKPETVVALLVVSTIFVKWDMPLEVTSIVEGRHSRKSLHYPGFALDIGLKGFINEGRAKRIALEIDQALTLEFDVVLEWAGEDGDHIHIEFQPKNSH